MKKNTSIFIVFIDFIRQYPRQFFILFSLLLVEGLVACLSVLAVVPLAEFLMDEKLIDPSIQTKFVVNLFSLIGLKQNFWNFGLLFVIINLIKSLISILVRYAILVIKYDVLGDLTGNTVKAFFKARWEFFSHSQPGEILNTMHKEVGNIGDTLGHIATLLAQCVQLIVFLSIPIWLNPTLTLTTVALSIVFSAPFFMLSKLSYRLGKLNTSTANNYVAVISETFSSIRLILSFGRQAVTHKKYMNAYQSHVSATLRSQTLNAVVHTLFQPMAMLAVILAISFSLKYEAASISQIAAIMWSLLSAMPLLSGILQGKISISNFLPSYEQLISLKGKAIELKENSGLVNFDNFDKSIVIKDVSFSYPGRIDTLLGINVELKKGQITALIGESGSGKSTLTDLILGLEKPNSGNIFIDNIPLSAININSLRDRIGYVPQDPQLFHASIRDNLLWSYDSASEARLWEVLELANAANFVDKLPDKLDTIVGDRGTRLSGGQRQRIALARALIRMPVLLILDEATSALDSESESLIQQSIEKVAGDATVLIVAHRLSTIANANKIYILSSGKIVEDGSFEQLRSNPNGLLNSMLSGQHIS